MFQPLELLEARQLFAFSITPLTPPAPWATFVPHAINNSGQIAGDLFDASGHQHAALRSGSTFLDLGTVGGLNSSAQAINATGQVAGDVGFADGSVRPFRTGANGAQPVLLASFSGGGHVT